MSSNGEGGPWGPFADIKGKTLETGDYPKDAVEDALLEEAEAELNRRDVEEDDA